MEEWHRAAGAIAVERAPLGSIGPSTHAYGGTRMGDNAETNVVDRFGFSHEAPNLGVLGASVMGTSGARNPTLTVQALAWRTAEHLIGNWKKIGAALQRHNPRVRCRSLDPGGRRPPDPRAGPR